MTKNKFIPALWTIAILVGIYQLPLIENTLNQHNIITGINDKFTYSKNLQQTVENTKISISAYYENVTTSKPTTYAVMTPEVQAEITPILVADNSSKQTRGNIIIEPESVAQSTVEEHLIEKKKIELSNTNLAINATHNISESIIIDKTSAVQNNEYCKNNCKVLMIGDSVMGDVEFSMVRLLKKQQPSWKVISGYKVSSGLTNQQYYDWPKIADKLVSQYKPDYVFVLMGTNDAQNMIINGKAAVFGKDNWKDEYKNRVLSIVNNLDNNSPYWLWIQLPSVKNTSFNQRLSIIRNVQADGVGTQKLLETASILGSTSESVNMSLRASDGTHLNSSGANLLAQHLYKRLSKDAQVE